MKIIVSENTYKKIIEEENIKNKLPKFIMKKILNHNTSLGANDIFPPEEDASFEYSITKKRFLDVEDEIIKIYGKKINNIDFLISELSSLIFQCKKEEKIIRHQLEKLCLNVLIDLFKIPSEVVNFECKIVDKIDPKIGLIQITPEAKSERNFDFKDIDDFHNAEKSILKRRYINSLIQGASYLYGNNPNFYQDEINSLNPNLMDLYKKIRIINDYLLFVKEEEIDEKNPKQGAYVEVLLGSNGEKTTIHSQGIIFPMLLTESIRGFFELFASHGLPKDNKKASFIIKRADFLLAEPWDLRLGVGLWEIYDNVITDTTVLPFFFSNICKIRGEEFNKTNQEILLGSEKGKDLLNDILSQSEEERDYNDFLVTMKQKNVQQSLINDEELTPEDLDNFIISEDLIKEDFYEISQIKHNDELYDWTDWDCAQPFFYTHNCTVEVGEKGTTHSDYDDLFDTEVTVAFGRIFHTIGDNEIIICVTALNYRNTLSDIEVKHIVSDVCNKMKLDYNKVYFIDPYTSTKLTKLTPKGGGSSKIARQNQEDGWGNATQAEINWWKRKGLGDSIKPRYNVVNENKKIIK